MLKHTADIPQTETHLSFASMVMNPIVKNDIHVLELLLSFSTAGSFEEVMGVWISEPSSYLTSANR